MAHIAEWRVRETTTTEGTADIVLAGAMFGSLPFQNAAVMAVGDTCDYVIHYESSFESGLGTMAVDGKLTRTTVYRSKHSNGDINTTKVSFPPGVKTVIMTARASKLVRTDIAQTFTAGETAQHRANAPPFVSGTRLIFQQTSAPVGWTKDVASHNDKVLRFTTGAVGSGGVLGFSTVFGRTSTDYTSPSLATTVAHNHAGTTTGQSANHTHSYTESGNQNQAISTGTGGVVTANKGVFGNNTGGFSADHVHSIFTEGSSAAHLHPMDIRVQYADAIIATAV